MNHLFAVASQTAATTDRTPGESCNLTSCTIFQKKEIWL